MTVTDAGWLIIGLAATILVLGALGVWTLQERPVDRPADGPRPPGSGASPPER